MKFLSAFFTKFVNEFTGNIPDQYVPIAVAPQMPEVRVASQEVRTIADQLNFGKNTERFVEMAVANYSDEMNQIKWLRAIATLRSTKRRWMLDPEIRVSKVVPA